MYKGNILQHIGIGFFHRKTAVIYDKRLGKSTTPIFEKIEISTLCRRLSGVSDFLFFLIKPYPIDVHSYRFVELLYLPADHLLTFFITVDYVLRVVSTVYNGAVYGLIPNSFIWLVFLYE